MSNPSADELSDDNVDAALKLVIFDYNPRENYPEFGYGSLRDAYRAGFEDGQNV